MNEFLNHNYRFQIIRGISQSLNFSLEFFETDDASTEQWGTKTENGTYTGLLGEMVYLSLSPHSKSRTLFYY